ncbi:unnamed protein product [Mytilus edulis]|uniref:PKD/REJ-like domain-containing protein n=1 Tax=Mytilus edulis TaxID=6550 RepID=A0A8S3SA98_MYTED|nr:unnamed protein product [Mytilus edulis]
MGATDILIPDYGGIIAVSMFSFTVSGVGPGATYEVSISSSQTFILTDEPSVKTNIYPNFEKFNPKVIAYNSTFYEITYTEQPVRAEEPMTGVNISLPLKIDLPPGNILVNVSLTDVASSLPFINCTFFMGDLIDRKMYYIYKNLTVSNPYLFYFTYITLGNHSATINCSNAISHVDYVVTVNVWNQCFQPTGMFDRDYSNETNPLVLYTSQDTDLGSRMAVYCTEQHVTYVWELTTVDANGTYSIPYAYEPVVPATGIIRFAKGSIEENIYKVTLNVTLDTTWVYEPTYIKFVKPPPFAYILGGNLLSVKLNKLSVKFDAMTGSYDVMYGEGANQNLTFAWTCKRFSTNQLDALSNQYETAKQNNLLDTYPDCMDKLEQESNDTNGILNMNLTVQEGYAVSVEVFLDNLTSNYTQLLQAREGGAPDVGIMCILNCDRKYATTLKSIYQAICHDCEPGEINDLSFLWSLQGINDAPFDFKTITLTDINTATISIAADKLLQGKEYKLWVSASGGWGRTADNTQTGRTLWTNSPPYNGNCIASPTEGNATTTSFSIYCSGFLDEGDNFDQDIVRDKNENRALKYKYFAMDKYINPDGTERLERSETCLKEEKCVICQNSISHEDTVVVLGEKGSQSVNKASKSRQDNVVTSAGQKLHQNCRKSYTNPKYNALANKDINHETTNVPTLRSKVEFDFKKHCLFCGQLADAVIGRKRKSDVYPVRTSEVRGRLAFVQDLHAADALYHQTCSVNFRTLKQTPLAFSPPAKKAKTQAGRKSSLSESFLFAAKYLQQNEDEQITVADLVKKMSEHCGIDDAYGVQHMKNELQEHFGDKVIISEINGKPNVVTFRNTVRSILQEFYEQTNTNRRIDEEKVHYPGSC